VPTTAATGNGHSSRLAAPKRQPNYGSSLTASNGRAFGASSSGQQRSSSASSTHATTNDIYASAPPSTATNPNFPSHSNITSHHYNAPPQIQLNNQEIETAPPIAWSSSFTPSSEHPERHRTKHQTSSVKVDEALQVGKAGLQRSYQKLKLDVSFGLLKLKK
jgi:hypothetical protein